MPLLALIAIFVVIPLAELYVIFGGAFLITPGFITDVLGFLLLIPITRVVFRRTLQARLALRTIPIRRPSRYDYDVEGTASEHYEPPPPSAELPPATRSRRPRT